MAKTAVGLFKDSSAADAVVKALGAGGFPSKDIRVLREPLDMPSSGALSTPRTDFEVALGEDLKAMGATDAHVSAYVKGVRRGGTLVFATAEGDKADAAVGIMNSHGASGIEEVSRVGLPNAEQNPPPPERETAVLAGRTESSTSGAQLFVW